MNERKDDIIIGLLVIIIIMQMYGLLFGRGNIEVVAAGEEPVAASPAALENVPTDIVATEAPGSGNLDPNRAPSLPDTRAEADAAARRQAAGGSNAHVGTVDDPSSGANLPGVPGAEGRR